MWIEPPKLNSGSNNTISKVTETFDTTYVTPPTQGLAHKKHLVNGVSYSPAMLWVGRSKGKRWNEGDQREESLDKTEYRLGKW